MAEGADLLLDPVAELLQPDPQHLMVVAAAGVAGDGRFLSIGIDFVVFTVEVIHAARNDGQRPGRQLGGPRAERSVARHILHLAMPALRQPLEQPRLRRRKVGRGDADRLEAELDPPLLYALRKRRIVHGPPS